MGSSMGIEAVLEWDQVWAWKWSQNRNKYGHRNSLGDSKSMSKVVIEMICMTNLSLFTMFGCRVYPLTERDTLLLDWVKVGECGINTVL